MVSTRRTAHSEPDPDVPEPDLSQPLRKKPVRRATAKKTEPEPQQKPKTTRGRKAAPAPDKTIAEESALEEPEPAQPAKPARKVGRPGKEAPAPAAAEPALVQLPTKPTRSTAASRAKNTEAMAEKRREIPAPSEPKVTRRTRATATAPKAQPLSPKKITQVSMPQTRNVKATNPKQGTIRPAPRSRLTRKRTVSDENADIPDLTSTDQEDDDVVLLSSTPVKRMSPTRQAAITETGVESEASMSSAPTTPSHSPAPSFDRINDEHEYRQRSDAASVAHASDEEDANSEEAHDSNDELCGPKTPMKRSSPGAEARYLASVQRTIRRAELNTPMESPRTFANRITKVGTPQTQKPYNRPAVPASETRPMTVARGSERAFVFKDLQAVPTVEEEHHSSVSDNDQSSVEGADEDAYVDQDQVYNDAQSPALVGVHGGSELTLSDHAEIPDDDSFHQDEASQHEIGSEEAPWTEDHEVEASQEETNPEETILIESDQEGASQQETDPEETILIESDQDSQASSPTAPYSHAFESEDTVLISREEDDSLFIGEDDHEEADHAPPSPTSPTPETLVWENIRQDVTISLDFDGHMAGARVMLQAETTERLSLVADFAPFPLAGAERDVVAGAEKDDVTDQGAHQSSPSHVQNADSGFVREGLDHTMDLNDFIDMASLAESTQAFELPSTSVHDSSKDDSAISDASSESPEETQNPSDIEDEDDEARGVMQLDFDFELVEGDLNEFVHMETEADFDQFEQRLEEVIAEETEREPNSLGATEEPHVPHYALPTLAFDARRKSLPAFGMQTPVKNGARPYTSDGASMPRMVNAFGNAWWSGPRAESTVATPVRPSTAHGFASAKKAGTPGQPIAALAAPTTPSVAPKERYPRREPRQDYHDHAQTAAGPPRFRTPVKAPVRRPATAQKPASSALTPRASTLRPRHKIAGSEDAGGSHGTDLGADATPAKTPSDRYPRLEQRHDYQDHAKTAAAPTRFHTPAKAGLKRPVTTGKAAATALTPHASSLKPKALAATTPPDPSTPISTSNSPNESATPVETPSERFPRLAPREDYVEHAKTIAAPAVFRTPAQTPLKRPSTTQKPGFLRKMALTNNTPMPSHTPVKTPLKPPAMTPSQAPMTPHPAAPLRGVTAMVEVFTLEGASASAPFIALLHRLGAKTAKVWSDRVTHVIFKDGSPTTLQRVRLHNKDVDGSGKGNRIRCVNSRWVSDCEAEGTRVDEADEEYAVDVAEIPRGGKRRRKSMEPSALVNLGGNIVRDRKSSLGRGSLGRSPLKFDSPAKKLGVTVAVTPKIDLEDKENSGGDDMPSSPSTPAYLSAPSELVQQTAPINRMRKLGLKAQDRAKNRRLTYFPSRA
ncbi:hypothetical protein LTR36_002776 [Oleoguttula mirabilis]|uniref:BRCT domain-containing protein n=1 Tax=Oleoguttula mirabilis TaxID=1507867 RepID=A0AAV9JJF1_9PEZI|nr:hypothetical protein LTR36_002776 [Oleoguttula mirabilis]